MMKNIVTLLIFMTFLTGTFPSARAETAPQPRKTVLVFIGKHRPANSRPTHTAHARLASFIAGSIAPMLGKSDAHNVISCADCAVVVQ